MEEEVHKSQTYKGPQSHSATLSYATFNLYKYAMAVLFVGVLRTH